MSSGVRSETAPGAVSYDDVAHQLARWAVELAPTSADLALADAALLDTLAVIVAGRDTPVVAPAGLLPRAGRWSALGHVLDFDDLHVPTTTHISVVCVPAVLAAGGDPRAYLAGAGVMARLGRALGWGHYLKGWHATCTAGAPAAAAATAVAIGLDVEQTAQAMALAVPAAGGVQRAFGTDAKSLQVGFATEAGVRAARLVAAGADADPRALGAWLELMADGAPQLGLDRPEAVPGGLAMKVYPCCYALQRPIACVSELVADVDADDVERIVVTTPESTVQPLTHSRPTTGLQAKFSLEHAVAVAIADSYAGFESFEDSAVRRREVTRLTELVEVRLTPGGDWLLDGAFEVEVHLTDGGVRTGRMVDPPGSPAHPASPQQVEAKVRDCCGPLADEVLALTWETAPAFLDRLLPA